MSGHSKWHNIRLRKGKVDAQRGALFTKLSKEIILAVRGGSPDPEANYRLKMAMEKARANNMPRENIARAVARGSGAGNEREIEEIRYEGHGPHGLAVIADAATDNRNRTAGELRFLFQKHKGVLGETGSVGWMFDRVGVIEVDATGCDEDGFLERALIDGVIDVEFGDPNATVFCEIEALRSVREALGDCGFAVRDAYLGVRAKSPIALEGEALSQALAFYDALEEHPDIVRVFMNLDVSEAALEELAVG